MDLYAGASRRPTAVVMALGAGVLLSSAAFELMDEADKVDGIDAPPGLLLGAAIL